MLKATITALLALTGAPSLARDVPEQAAAPAAPATRHLLETEPFTALLGRWRGAGRFGPSGDPVSSTMTFSAPNRRTIALQGVENAPNTYRYSALWSVEKETGRLLMLMASSLDGPALYHSAGWIGNRMVFEPDAGVRTGPSSVRFTYVRIDRDTFELTYEFTVREAWLLGDRQVFKRIR